MSISPIDQWTEKLEAALAGYDVSLLRAIAMRMLRTRNQWPADELRERLREAIGNPPVIDRRLKEIPLACRKLLAMIGLSRRPGWKVGQLLEFSATLGHAEGLTPIQTLFDEGLLHPVERSDEGRIKSFDYWLSRGSIEELQLFAHPMVTRRTRQEDLDLPALPTFTPSRTEARETDGLDWPLRWAIAWQQIGASPFRLTIQHDFFKRDLQRLRADPLLAAPFADHLFDLADHGLLAVDWARQMGILQERDAELVALEFGPEWRAGLPELLLHAWRALCELDSWDPVRGWEVPREGSHPFATTYPLMMALLAAQPADAWVRTADVASWIIERHPFWGNAPDAPNWGDAVSLGLFFQLRLVQIGSASAGGWLVRLSPLGRRLLGSERFPAETPSFPQTLMVQANFEILVFRQGLTPGLVADLSRFALWKSLGTACVMELAAQPVYRGLESGLGLEDVRQILQRHGMRPVPDNVQEALRTWANKRERLVIYNDATVVEFSTAADLHEAVRRGLVEVALTDRLGLVRNEDSLDFSQFRLTGRRDYTERPDRCLTVEEDGLTLIVDAGRADLLLESELARVAEAIADTSGERRVHRLTRPSMLRALAGGFSLMEIDEWLNIRAGQPLSPAARLLAASNDSIELRLETCLVLYAPSVDVADALVQWPVTRGLIRQRLGPTALAVSEENVPRLRDAIGMLQQRVL